MSNVSQILEFITSVYKTHRCDANLVGANDLLASSDWTNLDLSHPRYLIGVKLIPIVSNSVIIDSSIKLFLNILEKWH